MKVAFLVTGSGGSFYCSNCYRDMLYFRAVKMAEGVNAKAIPLYLPPEKEYIQSGFDTNVFFGAISLYIKERVHALENMPLFMEKILDSSPLLKLAAKRAGTTRAGGMEKMTLDMIDSRHTSRLKEVERLVHYLEKDGKPDIIHLSNALIIGLAKQIKQYTDVKIICSLQNEDDWINDMAEPYQSQAWDMMGTESKEVDAFISPSSYFKDFFIGKTGLAREKVFVVPSGIDLTGVSATRKDSGDPAIGFFSRVSHHNGFDKLVDAFIKLRQKDFPGLSLHVCGGYTGDDKPFISEQIKKIRENGYKSSVKIYPGFHGKSKEEFLGAIDLLSVPVRKYDGYGLYIIEANAAGIPAVLPATGAFPEILSITGGGLIYQPDTVDMLAEKIKELLLNRKLSEELGEKGRNAVLTQFTLGKMSSGLKAVYEKIVMG